MIVPTPTALKYVLNSGAFHNDSKGEIAIILTFIVTRTSITEYRSGGELGCHNIFRVGRLLVKFLRQLVVLLVLQKTKSLFILPVVEYLDE